MAYKLIITEKAEELLDNLKIYRLKTLRQLYIFLTVL